MTQSEIAAYGRPYYNDSMFQAPTGGHPLSSVQRDQRLPEKVVEKLTEAILSGVLPAGSRLPPERCTSSPPRS